MTGKLEERERKFEGEESRDETEREALVIVDYSESLRN